MKKTLSFSVLVAAGFVVFSIGPASGLEYDFSSNNQGWSFYTVMNDTPVVGIPAPWDSGGFLTSSVSINAAGPRSYGFFTDDLGVYGLDFTGMSVTVDFRAPGDGTLLAQGGDPLVRVFIFDGNTAYVSDDAHSWNPNLDKDWTTHTLNLEEANFIRWPWADGRDFNDVLDSVHYIGLVFTASDVSPGALGEEYRELGFYSDSGGVSVQMDNFRVAPVPEPATILLLGSGLIGLAGLARRKLRK